MTREFFIVAKWSPYHSQVWDLSELTEQEIINLKDSFGDKLIHVVECPSKHDENEDVS